MANAMSQMVDALMVNPVDPAKVRAAIARGVAENDYEFKATAGQDGSHLHYACAQPHMTPEVVGLLLDAGINPRAQDTYGRLPLHVAVTRCADPRVADLLVEHGADVNAHDGNRSTPLHWSTMAGNGKMVDWLLAKGARANAVNLDADTPLHHAAICRNPEIAARLVEAGAALDVQDKHGRTPLHVAIVIEDERTARLLVDAGARMNIRDRDGDTPRALAKAAGMTLTAEAAKRSERQTALER